MRINNSDAQKYKNCAPIFTMDLDDGETLEVLGFTRRTDGERDAVTRRGDRYFKVLVRYNAHLEPYLSILDKDGHRRLYLN